MTVPCDARCCDAAEVPLLEADILRLERATERPRATFVEEADGWRLLKGTGLDGCTFRGPLEVEGRTVPGCTVHADRPEACRMYPFILADGPRGPVVARDTGCPFANDFGPEPDAVLPRLVALEGRLEAERQERHDDAATHAAPPTTPDATRDTGRDRRP